MVNIIAVAVGRSAGIWWQEGRQTSAGSNLEEPSVRTTERPREGIRVWTGCCVSREDSHEAFRDRNILIPADRRHARAKDVMQRPCLRNKRATFRCLHQTTILII